MDALAHALGTGLAPVAVARQGPALLSVQQSSQSPMLVTVGPSSRDDTQGSTVEAGQAGAAPVAAAQPGVAPVASAPLRPAKAYRN